MGYSINWNTTKLKQLTRAQATALAKTAEAVHTDVVQSQVIPFDTGNLQNSNTSVDLSDVDKGQARIVSTTPYARRLYYHPEYTFNQVENPNARGNWYEPWISGERKDFSTQAFSKFYKKEAGI